MNNINDRMAELMGWVDGGEHWATKNPNQLVILKSGWNPDTDMNQAIRCWGKAKQALADDKVMELANRFTDILFAEGNLPLAICEAILEAVKDV